MPKSSEIGKMIDIVNLIENNPIVNLSTEYNNRLVNKIKDSFTETQQHLFVSSFYCYLNYHPTADFVIDLDDIWKWLGFHAKQNAKILLEKNFIKDKDYILLMLQDKQTNETRGGHNKQTFLLNIRCFKLFCIKAGTEKANEIHEYFVKLEDIMNGIVKEECKEQQGRAHRKWFVPANRTKRPPAFIPRLNTPCWNGFVPVRTPPFS